MTKERLEEIKTKFNYEKLGEFIDAKLISPYDLKWLIEQAERVKELEGTEDAFLVSEKWRMEAEQQNKRYREALRDLKRILDTYPHVDYSKGKTRRRMFDLANKALEGEE